MPLGSIIGGVIGANGDNQAGSAAAASGNQAYQEAQAQAAQLRNITSPWSAAGIGAESQLSALYGNGYLGQTASGEWTPDGGPSGGVNGMGANAKADQAAATAAFQTSPGYQFRLQQGVNALNNSAAARGMQLSGAQTKALSDYGQNTGSAEYGNYVNELNSLAGGGLTASQGQASLSAGLVGQGIQDQFQGGTDQAAMYASAGNALASGIGKGMQNLGAIAGFKPAGTIFANN